MIPEFKDALQLICTALPCTEKAINNAVKDFRKRLQGAGMCVSQWWRF